MSDETQETGVNSNEAADTPAPAPAEQSAADAPEVKDEPIEEELPAPPVADAQPPEDDVTEEDEETHPLLRLEMLEDHVAFMEAFLLTLPEYKFFKTRHA
ncbi:MAG: hypothetical protein ABSG90_13795 [Dehalococcoidia bacterium]|jgi:hypothetical protein